MVFKSVLLSPYNTNSVGWRETARHYELNYYTYFFLLIVCEYHYLTRSFLAYGVGVGGNRKLFWFSSSLQFRKFLLSLVFLVPVVFVIAIILFYVRKILTHSQYNIHNWHERTVMNCKILFS